MPDYSFDRPIAVSDLLPLITQAGWALHRTLAEVGHMLTHSQLQIGVWEGNVLIGYARAITDFRYRALIEDVIVERHVRGIGFGSEMIRRLVERLQPIEQVIVIADDDTAPFYQRLGFITQVPAWRYVPPPQ